ncbi:MAG: hypothetical protein QM602_05865, partial [Microbacterium sp.]
ALQHLGFPAASFTISVLYPSGIAHYSITQAIAPTLLLGLIAVGVSAWLVHTARRNPRLA